MATQRQRKAQWQHDLTGNDGNDSDGNGWCNDNGQCKGNAMVTAAMDSVTATAMNGTTANGDEGNGWHNGNGNGQRNDNATATEGTTTT